ncbi:MAG: MaoC family dehydratase N-terminal domain-containing protein [Dehalococcoidia bacterium]
MPVLTREHQALIGAESPPRPASDAVNEAMARHWCEMVEDANPIYFDEAYARSTWLEGAFAPPTMLFTWAMPPPWPEVERESPAARLQFDGCTSTIAVKAVQESFAPLRYGDTLTIASQIASISEEKTTRLGTGHFVTTTDTFRNQREEVVGTHSFVLFMYRPAEGGGS